ncbi:ras-induced vulval development antagonist-domain-containing protein [Hygrophoropsis aurantiaca]|uniref:Ras-induced vulval development antagonist-domain-containing protein n=1 Tax=Hygrophoropsis aurantiaca TaxID=72124 RepID=A0ACB8AIH1_9AGAM|nr:ras-induced vulval development antagonist-domain-containing protein [Hygrophoropsis aurantiaca]
MATVHPSRMGLVPADIKKDNYSERRRGRSPSPRARSPRRESRDHRDKHRESDKDRHDYSSSRRDRSRDRDHTERRRASPVYSDYRRPPTPPPADDGGGAPWRKQENMYPGRQRDRPPHADRSFGPPSGMGGSEYLESRRLQRETSTISIWPASPKASARGLSPTRDSKSRKKSSKRDRSETPTDSSDDEDRRRRERKEKKRARKEKDRVERKEKKEKKKRTRNYEDSDDEDRTHRRNRSKTRSKSRTKSKSRGAETPSPSRTPSPARPSEEDEWVEKPSVVAPFISPSHAAQSSRSMPPPSTIPSSAKPEDEDSDDELGPQPLYKINAAKRVDERAYGGALLRGEGSAMAAFLQDDTDSRIPRRGEIGLTSDEIAQFESVGYVMSGSRHKRMNAVRMRKENQVISAEEKRGILKLQKEERERREAILREEFSELVSERLKGPESRPK